MNASSLIAVDTLCASVMRAVVASGCVRNADRDGEVAVRIMREELKSFLFDAKYENERSLVLFGDGNKLAVASLTTECVSRILKERAQ